MAEDLKWLIGLAVAVIGGGFWRVVLMIHREEDARDGANREIHSRINRVREDMVHKSDLEARLNSISTDIREMRTEIRAALSTGKRSDG